jgi:capsular exopolysaccharide synthesis family protein
MVAVHPTGVDRGDGVSTPGTQLEEGPSIVESVWRFRYRIAAVVLLFGLLGYWLSGMRPQRYSATSNILYREPNENSVFNTGEFELDPERFILQQASRITSRTVLQRAGETVGNETFESLQRVVSVHANAELNQVEVTATDPTPHGAADTANAVAEAYEQLTSEENAADVEQANLVLEDQIAELNETVDQLDARLRRDPNDRVAASRLRTIEGALLALETRASELAANAAVRGSGIRLREPAIAPEVPSSPKPVRDAAVLSALAFAVASAVAYARAGARRRVEDRTDPGSVLKVPLLGEIPKFSRLGWDAGGLLPGGEASEAYQFVLSSIEFSLAEINATSLVITSAAPGDGKTSTALQIAVASAQEARRVTLVDSDVRAHGLTSLLHAEEHAGLVELTQGHALDDCIRQYRLTDASRLAVVPAGRPPKDPTRLMRSPEFKKAVENIKSAAELTIFDSPPLLAVTDASILASQVDAMVLVVDRNTEVDQLLKVQERLAFVSTRVIGYVYNRTTPDRATRYGYGSSATTSRPLSRLVGGERSNAQHESG